MVREARLLRQRPVAENLRGASDDYAESVQATSNGGYILAGGTNSFGAEDFSIVAFNHIGGLVADGGEKPDAGRDKNAAVNKLIAKFDDGRAIRFLDIGDKFLEADKSMSKDVMGDFLHPSQKGYGIWAQAIDEPVKELLKESNSAALAGPGPYKKLASQAAQIKAGLRF